jgi:hypothetical protein
MLLVVGLMAIGGVVALAWMAQRYSEVLGVREGASGARPPQRAVVDGLSDADAVRYVEAYLGVRQALDQTLAEQPDGATTVEVRRALDEALDRQLGAVGLDRVEFQEIESVYAAWRAGQSDVPPGFRQAFERRRRQLDELDAEAQP